MITCSQGTDICLEITRSSFNNVPTMNSRSSQHFAAGVRTQLDTLLDFNTYTLYIDVPPDYDILDLLRQLEIRLQMEFLRYLLWNVKLVLLICKKKKMRCFIENESCEKKTHQLKRAQQARNPASRKTCFDYIFA